jgi:hypothetical protein
VFDELWREDLQTFSLLISLDVIICFSRAKVVRAGLDVEFAPDLVANQLNVRNGALVLLVIFSPSFACCPLKVIKLSSRMF